MGKGYARKAWQRGCRRWWLAVAIAMAALNVGSAVAVSVTAGETGTDAAAIAHVIKSTWEKPGKGIDVGPVVLSGGYAVTGWVQGERGGRALLKKSERDWSVVLCSGDGIRSAEGLRAAGVPEAVADDLSARLAVEESSLPPAHVAKFSLFEGTSEPEGAAPHHHPGAAHH